MILWIKCLHILAIISWLAGLLYLPRLFVYHCQADAPKIFEQMEYRLLKYIMNPAMLVSLATGLYMAFALEFWADSWFILKFVAVGFLLASHGRMAWHRRQFANGNNRHSPKYFRILNEVPTILMIIIVIMVVVKP